VLVAHSLGCQTVVHWAATHEQPIAGALLVAPPDLESDEAPLEEMGFHPVPLQPLSFPAILVASENDIYCAVERAREMAYAWGTRFVSAGECGHLNTAAGFGPWPYGEILLLGLLAAQG
jgi:predicted alpha/beta hydrolase family esterase